MHAKQLFGSNRIFILGWSIPLNKSWLFKGIIHHTIKILSSFTQFIIF